VKQSTADAYREEIVVYLFEQENDGKIRVQKREIRARYETIRKFGRVEGDFY
jgi:hypothetical protein